MKLVDNQAASEDKSFIGDFEALAIAPTDFSHRSHIRMAYTYLCEHDTPTTQQRIREGLCRLLSHFGIEPTAKYHETLTQSWVLAVRHFMTRTPGTTSSSEFIDANPQLLDSSLMMTHYSKSALFSDKARRSFIEPDISPIPNA